MEANAAVVGASFDTPEDNKAFAEAQSFPYPLLSDVDKRVGEAYGTRRPDDDPMAIVPRRLTFLVDPGGVIRRIYVVSDVAAHAQEVLADVLTAAGH